MWKTYVLSDVGVREVPRRWIFTDIVGNTVAEAPILPRSYEGRSLYTRSRVVARL